MPVVLLLAAVVVILTGVVAVAMGRGGELELSVPDSATHGRDLVTAADMATFRPPSAFLGYSAQVTDEALRRIARAVAERDAELAMLRHEVAVLRARQFRPGAGPATAVDDATPAGRATPADPGAARDYPGQDVAGQDVAGQDVAGQGYGDQEFRYHEFRDQDFGDPDDPDDPAGGPPGAEPETGTDTAR